MKKKLLSIIVAVLCFFSSECVTLKITCRSKGMELVLLKEAIDKWVKKTGNKHKVEIITLPHASNECFALYKQWLSAESFDVDILQMDAPWIGIFADYLTDLTEFYKEGRSANKENDEDKIDVDDYFEAVRNNMYSNGKMVALPLYTDCGIIFYRTDLLSKYKKPVPITWQELYQTAEYIQNEERKDPQKKNKFYGFVFQAKAFEGLTCNFVEMIDSFGGTIVNDDEITINADAGVNATMFLIDCLKSISSRGVLNYSEEDARGMFQSGNAVFMRNWPYAWSLLNDPSTAVAGKVGVIVIPPSANGGKSSGVLGGWSMTVSKYSKHKKYAADLIKFLTSKSQQRLWSKYSYAPAFKSLFRDSEVLKNNPFFAYLYDSLQNAVARPSLHFGKNYPRASTEIFNAINGILTDSIESDITISNVKKRLDRLNKKLNEISKKAHKDEVQSKEDKGLLFVIKKFLGFEM
ncbi:MAG: ABC transporter substrate-binding protein [Holosporaceae bacterium]|jgi:trehalose/maltose transport system substrate-binding protein|nr:ABC transporter substrate-binding protein [Holosporaceae bacterium]